MRQSAIGTYIRSLRLRKGLTQKALADRLHVTDKAVSKWERDLSFPDIALLPKLAETLDVGITDLIQVFDDNGPTDRLIQRYMVSPDLRAPLHIILGCAELVEMNRKDEEKVKRYLDAIRVSGLYLLAELDRIKGDKERSGETLEALLQNRDARPENLGESWDFTGERILIVDDILVNREIAGDILSRTGALLEYAEDGQACVDMVVEHHPDYYDLILMDLMMPNMNGIEATRKIRSMADPLRAKIPIIAITANVDTKDQTAAFDAGMNAFVEKPIRIRQLLETIKQFL